MLQWIRHPSAVNTNTIHGRLRWLPEQAEAKHAEAKHADSAPLILTPHDCRRVLASEHLNPHTPGAARPRHRRHGDDLRKLYPDQFLTYYRKAMRGLYADAYGPDASQVPSEAEWAEFIANCSLRETWAPRCSRLLPGTPVACAGDHRDLNFPSSVFLPQAG